MIGYGKTAAGLPDKKINVEIKSFNSKAINLSTRIAPVYCEREIEVCNEISKVLERGRADFSLRTERKEGADAVLINKDVLKGYYSQLDSISHEPGIPCPAPEGWLQLSLRIPGVMTKTKIQELAEEEWSMVHATVLEVISHLTDFRKQKEVAPGKKFREKIASTDGSSEQITPYEKERVEKARERITDTLERTLSVGHDKNRLEQEPVYYTEKLDVDKEKQRFNNHLKHFINTMEGGNEQSKKFSSIAQEMGREINTLGSKSNHAEMQKIIAQMRNELEQIKEQVLNAT